MREPIRTYVTPDEEFELRFRKGFTPLCQYGAGMPMEPNEVGCITKVGRKATLTASGVWSVECAVLERFFLKDAS